MAGLPPGLSANYWSRLHVDGPGIEGLGLSDGETWVGGWDGVGLYEGNSKVGPYQSLTFHLTTHRLLLVPDAASPSAIPLQAALSNVRQTEFYTGFMRSSPKITIYLGRGAVAKSTSSGFPEAPAEEDTREGPSEVGSWTCGVCAFSNPLPAGVQLGPDTKCQLCGVAWSVGRTLTPAATPSRSGTPASTAPTDSRGPTPAPSTLAAPTPSKPSTPAPENGNSKGKQIACPACTFLNHPSMTQCEICGTSLRKRTASTAGASALGEDGAEKHDVVRISFRKGGASDAYKRLKGVLGDKAWERVSLRPVETDKSGAGIDAIMRNITLSARQADGHVQAAFRDLELMMVRAGEMVQLAQSLNAKLQSASGATEEEETLVRSSLVKMGLPTPALTKDMVKDERAYLEGLAKELGALLTGPPAGAGGKGKTSARGIMLEPGNGVIALDTVWGLWMRMRGVALLPPSTLMRLLDILPLHTRPVVRKLELPSGLVVLYAPNYDPEAWRRRLIARLTAEDSGLSPLQVSAAEGVPLGLGEELTELAARRGGIVRDDQARGGRWYADLISEWPLGQLAQ